MCMRSCWMHSAACMCGWGGGGRGGTGHSQHNEHRVWGRGGPWGGAYWALSAQRTQGVGQGEPLGGVGGEARDAFPRKVGWLRWRGDEGGASGFCQPQGSVEGGGQGTGGGSRAVCVPP